MAKAARKARAATAKLHVWSLPPGAPPVLASVHEVRKGLVADPAASLPIRFRLQMEKALREGKEGGEYRSAPEGPAWRWSLGDARPAS